MAGDAAETSISSYIQAAYFPVDLLDEVPNDLLGRLPGRDLGWKMTFTRRCGVPVTTVRLVRR